METQDLDVFGDISLESDSFSSEINLRKPSLKSRFRPSPKRLLPPLKPIDFECYLRDNCHNKIKLLQRETFHQITKPIVIFFNHFREKCAYHTKCLDKLYQLAGKYEEHIDFIAGDMLDIDVMNPKWHAIDLFCSIQSPEKVTSIIYAIDEQKRVYEPDNGDKSVENLMEICENLLKGKLFNSQPLPAANNSSLVKICVTDNYRELVTNSEKYILLITDLEDYCDSNNPEDLPNYETVALELASYNVEVVYLNAEKNYVPFELSITNYPSILLIPPKDKTNFVNPIKGAYTQENIITSIKSYLKDPQHFLLEKQKELKKISYQPLEITPDFNIDFTKLQQYLQVHCQQYLKVFERQAFLRGNRYVIIAFMDFKNGKCLAEHLEKINEIYQVARKLASPREYYIADYQDIEVINCNWKPQDFTDKSSSDTTKLKIFGIDLNKSRFVLKDYQSPASLFYFAYSLTNGELYISESWPKINNGQLVKTCIADSLNLSINSCKQDIFLAIYYSHTENTLEFLQLLEAVAKELEKYPIKLMKIDARLNCISLEWDNTIYPTMYYIPQIDKSKKILFTKDNLNKKDIVEFIVKNIDENKVK